MLCVPLSPLTSLRPVAIWCSVICAAVGALTAAWPGGVRIRAASKSMLAGLGGGLGGARVSNHYARSRNSAASEAGDGASDSLGPNGSPCFPDGRKCLLCPRKDDGLDEVAQAQGKRQYNWWSKPPVAGETQGAHCGFCYQYFQSQVKLIVPISMKEYETFLGGDPERLSLHQARGDPDASARANPLPTLPRVSPDLFPI